VKLRLSKREIVLFLLLIISAGCIFGALAVVPSITIKKLKDYFFPGDLIVYPIEKSAEILRRKIDYSKFNDLNRSSKPMLRHALKSVEGKISDPPKKQKIDEGSLDTGKGKSADISHQKNISRSEFSYTIQLASCRKKENCLNVVTAHRNSKVFPFMVRANLGEKGVWWRVLVGQFATIEDAKKYKVENQLKESIITELQ